MNRRSVYVVLLLPALLLAACAREPLKAAGQQGENTLAGVRDIASAYERRDIEAFMERVASAYPERDTFRKEVDNIFSTYQTVRFTAQFRKMLVTVQHKGNIKATFTWEGEWISSGGKVLKDGARITLILDPAQFKLLGIEGKNPFLPQATPLTVR